MAYETNRFCWHGCISTDTDAAAAFYSEVLGWRTDTTPMGDGEATFFKAADKGVAHLAPPPMEGVPSHWNSYLRVDDVDASTSAAVKNGGKQIVPPTDIVPGRFSVVESPSGAKVSLFHEASAEESEHHPGGTGSFHWVELHSHKVDADIAWLESTFGYTTEQMDMPDGPYTILKDGDNGRGGVMKAMSDDAPSMWLAWVQVDDVDDTVTRAKGNQGNVIVDPFDVPHVGRCAIVEDPAGGVLGVIKPAAA